VAVYNLSGAGIQGLTAGTQQLRVEVITFPLVYSVGRASPPNYYDLGLLRLGNQGSYYPVRPIDAVEVLMDCPPGVTSLGYSLFGSTSIRVTEA
jgi:hypothetical protein